MEGWNLAATVAAEECVRA